MPGAASGSGGGAATLGYDSSTRLTPLTVNLGEFAAQVNAENREVLQFGAFFQWSSKTRQEHNVPMGPANPQALNRYAYCLNNPLRYVDPTGHSTNPTDPPPWMQGILVVWRNAPDWIRQLLFNSPQGGTRIIQIDHPHSGANYWHINSDLKLLGDSILKLDHKNIEPLLERLAAAKVTIDTLIASLSTCGEWTLSELEMIFSHLPMIVVPEYMFSEFNLTTEKKTDA